MPEKNESSPREACGLPKQGNACPYAKLAPDFAHGAAGARRSTRGGRRCR